MFFGRRLQDHFQIDRHRVIADRNHVLLMRVGGGETVEERKPRTGAPEKSLAALLILASRVIDELGPAITVPRHCVHGFERERGSGAVQTLDQGGPGGIDAQILRLVNDPRTVLEGDDLDRMAVVVRIGKIAGNVGDLRCGGGPKDIPADRRDIRIQPCDKFAPCIEPLPRDGRYQPQQDRLVFKQSAEAAIFHVGDELIVARRAGGLGLRR